MDLSAADDWRLRLDEEYRMKKLLQAFSEFVSWLSEKSPPTIICRWCVRRFDTKVYYAVPEWGAICVRCGGATPRRECVAVETLELR